MYPQYTDDLETGCETPAVIHQHFSRIARKYRNLRITDTEPIALIAEEMGKLAHVEAIDIGCGTGRYDLLLSRYLGDKLHLTCCDANAEMLKSLDKYLKKHGVSNFTSMRSQAENIPVPSGSLDCIFTFNAIHHFSLPEFLQESARILKSQGYLFIYTRLLEQNKNTIWGQCFPRYTQKETRLYSLKTLTKTTVSVPKLWIKSIEFFKYRRIATLEQLIERARACHYSTFCLYSPEELEESLAGFTQKLEKEFDDTQRIRWSDENVLLVIQKEY
ncbi:class I SAM-dependent methyltransferase [Chloroflexota bacterium]